MRTLARLVCCLFAVAAVSLPRYSPASCPLLCMPSWLAESEGAPVEERESNSSESSGIEQLIRCDGRRQISRPVVTAGSSPPTPRIAVNRRTFLPCGCPLTEHALRDGLGAPLRI
jgi:hypothetical protein